MEFSEVIRNIIEIAALTVMYFYILRVLRGTRGLMLLITVVVFLALLWLLANYFSLPVLLWILEKLLGFMPLFIIVIFKQEIRRILTALQMGSVRARRMLAPKADHPQAALLLPVIEHLHSNREGNPVGALIAIEQSVGLESWSVTGSMIGAKLHEDDKLLETIFFEGSPLHDGGVIIRKMEILAAACTFPLSTERDDGDVVYGMRHKAALGLSEQSDAVVIVVSEETGAVSLAYNGKMERMSDLEQLRRKLNSLLQPLRISESRGLIGGTIRFGYWIWSHVRKGFANLLLIKRHFTDKSK